MSDVRGQKSELKSDVSHLTSTLLPTRLNDAGNLTLERQLAKTDTTQVELAQVAARASAPFATSVCAHRKFWLAF